MAEPQELTRAELKRQLDEANAQLADFRRKADGTAAGPATQAMKLVPYAGFVRAREDCTSVGQYRKKGEIWYAELPALWSDDPFEAVVAEGEYIDVNGQPQPRYVPNPKAPVPNPHRLRVPSALEALREASGIHGTRLTS